MRFIIAQLLYGIVLSYLIVADTDVDLQTYLSDDH